MMTNKPTIVLGIAVLVNMVRSAVNTDTWAVWFWSAHVGQGLFLCLAGFLATFGATPIDRYAFLSYFIITGVNALFYLMWDIYANWMSTAIGFVLSIIFVMHKEGWKH